MRGKILLVEDNESIQENNRAMLERNGYTVRLAMNLAEARKEFKESSLDARQTHEKPQKVTKQKQKGKEKMLQSNREGLIVCKTR